MRPKCEPKKYIYNKQTNIRFIFFSSFLLLKTDEERPRKRPREDLLAVVAAIPLPNPPGEFNERMENKPSQNEIDGWRQTKSGMTASQWKTFLTEAGERQYVIRAYTFKTKTTTAQEKSDAYSTGRAIAAGIRRYIPSARSYNRSGYRRYNPSARSYNRRGNRRRYGRRY